MDEQTALIPTVRWSQRKETLMLVVQISNCGSPKINISTNNITFAAATTDEKSKNYKFSIDLYNEIDTESVVHKVAPHYVNIHLTKVGPGEWWPRLCKNTKKPHFLKLDFDNWISESDFEEQEAAKDKQQYEKEVQEVKEDLHRRSVLFIYNFIQFIFFLSIAFKCVIGLVFDGDNFYPIAYEACGKAVHFAVLLSYLEVLFVMAGLTKGKVKMSFLQICGRNFASLCLYLAADEISSHKYVTYLFLAWSSIELVRYPQYMSSILTLKFNWLEWLRYTVWIPLYPIGVGCELLVFINSGIYFLKNNLYSLPPMQNIRIGLWLVILLYCMLLPFGFSIVYIYMWKARSKRYGTSKKYKVP